MRKKAPLPAAGQHVAVKRDGTVLSATDYLTWYQAECALDRLEAAYASRLNGVYLGLISAQFPGWTVQASNGPRARAAQKREPALDRGIIYRSETVAITNGDLTLHLGFSISICVKIAGGKASDDASVSKSKIWQSAAILSPSDIASRSDFSDLCEKIEQLFQAARAALPLIYQECLREFNDDIRLKPSLQTDPEFKYIIFQEADSQFRPSLNKILYEGATVRDLKDVGVFSTLNKVYEANTANLLHFSRADASHIKSDAATGIDCAVYNDRHGGKAFFLYTWQDASKSRFVGVTSATEHVPYETSWAEEDLITQVRHSPASVLSAGLVAEVASRY